MLNLMSRCNLFANFYLENFRSNKIIKNSIFHNHNNVCYVKLGSLGGMSQQNIVYTFSPFIEKLDCPRKDFNATSLNVFIILVLNFLV